MAKKLSREGHRQRIRNSYIEAGMSGMQPHNILELLLTYAIPRRDVKETAYALLNSFDNDLGKVFSADINELESINGIGENAAVLIRLFGELPEFIEKSEKKNKAVINDYVSAKEYAKTAFAGCTDEEYKIICTNNSSKVISCDTLNFKKDKIGNVNPLEIIERMLRRQSATAILVHIKPHGNYLPDSFDNELILAVNDALVPLGMVINDFLIVGKDGTLSMSNDIRYMRYFNN